MSPSVYQPSPAYQPSILASPRSIAARAACSCSPAAARKPPTVTGNSHQLLGAGSWSNTVAR
ncbi:hypothetical protein HD597_000122 [Nonomuraea thailandensis]|uniref:Uncharacterized protein n=1 Tax=Nonomuraea thailandensis TaxID=1188745 RepID=A0A9X2G5Q8_9ACTN|nr:hypothetical protein [Nonomuraea thailandensis]MCP2353102.1 hypothetical protein [Nonomuraea thailandensis]